MAKVSKAYVCQECGSSFVKWKGRCDACLQWDCLVLEETSLKKTKDILENHETFESLSDGIEEIFPRISSGMKEFDRVCGSGIVAGSVSLVAGDPGIGKSTLLLQIAARLSSKIPVMYISGEESKSQIRLRAGRLGLLESSVLLMSDNHLERILQAIKEQLFTNPSKGQIPAFVIIDSIQTVSSESLTAACGTVSQVRECVHHLIQLAKSTGIALMIVGHITKEGMIAGPKVLEHMVDTVLYFEGERSYPYRLLRTVKNRFGATDEVGVFDMTEQGLMEVSHPSALFLHKRPAPVQGACIFAALEGTRPLLVEIQALSTPSFLASPRRSVVGWDHNRLSMILAVLEARCHLSFSQKDVFLTVIGGLKITEPAADLCVALALISCLKKKPLPQGLVAFGEIGLTGEISPVAYSDQRLKEALNLGFGKACLPQNTKSFSKEGFDFFEFHRLNHVQELDLWFKSCLS